MDAYPEQQSPNRGQPVPQAGGATDFSPQSKQFGWRLAGTAAVAGFAAAIAITVLGRSHIDPTNAGWLNGDFFLAHLSWANYRVDSLPPFQFATTRLSTPLPLHIGLFGALPLFWLVMRFASPLLPAQAQIIGIYLVFAVVLQAVFAFLIFHDYARRRHRAPAATAFAIIATLFVAAAPILIWRWRGHVGQSSQWLILAALWLYFRSERVSWLNTMLSFAALLVIAGGINPYFSIMVSLVYGGMVVKWLLDRNLRSVTRVVACTIPPILGVLALVVFGFLPVGGRGMLDLGGGYGFYSANMLTLVNPDHWIGPPQRHSLFLPDLPRTFPGQYEGYGYLGFGAIVMAITAIGWSARCKRLASRNAIPLAAIAVAALVLALTTTVTFGPWVVVKIPVPHWLNTVLSSFDSSGRFIFVSYYVIIVASALLLAKTLPTRMLVPAIGTFAILQFVDLAPTWALMRADIAHMQAPRLTDPAWSKLAAANRALLAVPPYQCNPDLAPGGPHGNITIARAALEAGIVTNDFFVGRVPREVWDYQCDYFGKQFDDVPIESDVAYTLREHEFLRHGQRLAATHFCELADDDVLCRAGVNATGFGARLTHSIASMSVHAGTSLGPAGSRIAGLLREGWRNPDSGAPIMSARAARIEPISALPGDQPVAVAIELHRASSPLHHPIVLDVYIASFYAGDILLDPERAGATAVFHVPAGLIEPGRLFSITLIDRTTPVGATRDADDSIELANIGFSLSEGVSTANPAVFVVNREVGDRSLLDSGWTNMENWGVWNERERATLRLPNIDQGDPLDIEINVNVFGNSGRGVERQTVQVAASGTTIENVTLDRGEQVLRIAIPAELAQQLGPTIPLEFHFPTAVSPFQPGEIEDARRLAIGIKTIVMAKAARSP